jgi:hypothetical protein
MRMARAMPVNVLIGGFLVSLAAAGCSSPGQPASAASPAHASVAITATSAVPPVPGDVYVEYRGGSDASARISGQISGVASGDVARLYAQQFPFSGAPARVASLALSPAGKSAPYAFEVSPTLATRYQVKLFRGGGAAAPLAASPATTVYVVRTKTDLKGPPCSPPVCREEVAATFLVPPSVLSTEMSKHWYTYFRADLSASGTAAVPQVLQLGAGDPVVAQPRQISADEFQLSLTYTFQVGHDPFQAAWRECLKDTEAQDGFGLPGRNGCGGSSVPAVGGYLG